jgi:hypothetical protein
MRRPSRSPRPRARMHAVRCKAGDVSGVRPWCRSLPRGADLWTTRAAVLALPRPIRIPTRPARIRHRHTPVELRPLFWNSAGGRELARLRASHAPPGLRATTRMRRVCAPGGVTHIAGPGFDALQVGNLLAQPVAKAPSVTSAAHPRRAALVNRSGGLPRLIAHLALMDHDDDGAPPERGVRVAVIAVSVPRTIAVRAVLTAPGR